VEQAAVKSGVEGLPEVRQRERICHQKGGRESPGGGLLPGRAIAVGAASTPVTSRPREARYNAFSPVPQPMSITEPAKAPSSASRSTIGCARPMSQAGVPCW
jgi:hypothetical protein